MSLGKGTKGGKILRGFIEEIEAVRERKKQLGEAESATFAEAKKEGFDVKTIRRILKLRELTPDERNNAEQILETYMHAIGMAEEPPLWAALAKFAVDLAAREEAVEFLKKIVPHTGEIILKLGAKPVRIWRDGDGNPQSEDVETERAVARSRAADEMDRDHPGATYGGVSPGGRALPKSHIDAAVERAERRAHEKRLAEAAAMDAAKAAADEAKAAAESSGTPA